MFNRIEVRTLAWPGVHEVNIVTPQPSLGGVGSAARCTVLLKDGAPPPKGGTGVGLYESQGLLEDSFLIRNGILTFITSQEQDLTTSWDDGAHHYDLMGEG